MKHSVQSTGIDLQTGSQPADLERAVLLTVLYADLFDFALTEDELYSRLVGVTAPRWRVQAATARLAGSYLSNEQGYITWRGREHLSGLRKRRKALALDLWTTAERYGRWLSRVPFVRMAAVSGSLAVENAEGQGDVDLFCVTEAGRLWVARLFLVPLSKLTRHFSRRFPLYLCPNTILALDALEVQDHNLFTAHEVVQAVPLWGREAYYRFCTDNAWVRDYMPHASLGKARAPTAPRRPALTRACEAFLRGRAGDVLDRAVHWLFLTFYQKRAERAGWTWAALAPAYQRNRYTVPEGGYVHVVHHLFAERIRERLNGTIPEAAVEALFSTTSRARSACYDWEEAFTKDYGGTCAGSKPAPPVPRPTAPAATHTKFEVP